MIKSPTAHGWAPLAPTFKVKLRLAQAEGIRYLGFRHEHIRLTTLCTSEAFTQARAITEYDVDSVMHYPQCRPSNAGGSPRRTLNTQRTRKQGSRQA